MPPIVPPAEPARPAYPPIPIVYESSPAVQAMADRLLDRRTVIVTGTLDLATATDASARLMLLDGSGDDPIDLVMSCPDGDLTAATALADTVELVGVEVRALCSGLVGGAALLPFVLATRRLAQPHATFRLSNPRHEAQGRASDLESEVQRHGELLDDLHRRVSDATGQDVDQVADDFAHNRLLTAPDARSYGIVHEIVRRRGLSAV
jgi:ATP-dependent Clp protease protease subunit